MFTMSFGLEIPASQPSLEHTTFKTLSSAGKPVLLLVASPGRNSKPVHWCFQESEEIQSSECLKKFSQCMANSAPWRWPWLCFWSAMLP